MRALDTIDGSSQVCESAYMKGSSRIKHGSRRGIQFTWATNMASDGVHIVPEVFYAEKLWSCETRADSGDTASGIFRM